MNLALYLFPYKPKILSHYLTEHQDILLKIGRDGYNYFHFRKIETKA